MTLLQRQEHRVHVGFSLWLCYSVSTAAMLVWVLQVLLLVVAARAQPEQPINLFVGSWNVGNAAPVGRRLRGTCS